MRLILSLCVVCLAGVVLAASSSAAAEEGFIPLFDGHSLEGWTGSVDGYTAADGVLTCVPDKGGNLFTAREFADFELRFEFVCPPDGNNGIGMRVPAGGHASYDGMEIQILDSPAAMYAKLQPYQYHGSVYGIIPAKRGYLRAAGAWNEQTIRLQGRHITVILNGETIVDGDLDVASANGTLDGKDHPGLKRTAGHLVLCGHGSAVQFRNLRIRDLAANP